MQQFIQNEFCGQTNKSNPGIITLLMTQSDYFIFTVTQKPTINPVFLSIADRLMVTQAMRICAYRKKRNSTLSTSVSCVFLYVLKISYALTATSNKHWICQDEEFTRTIRC